VYFFSRVSSFTSCPHIAHFSYSCNRCCKLSQAVAVVKYLISHSDVDQDGSEDADPDGNVVRIEAHQAPVRINPAPELAKH
jgi:hypothetical protein